jgi:D-amino-acid oxidase
VAAAVWYPYLAAPRDKVAAWSKTTYDEFAGLAEHEESVRLRTGTELLRDEAPDPWWAGAVPDLRRLTDRPDGYADGWSFTAPVVEMPRYLPYLVGRLDAAGGTLTRAALSALPNSAEVVVNCAGLGARRMAGDDSLSPVRGQIVYVGQPGLTEWLIAEDAAGEVTYVVPRKHDVVVGGTSQPGDWNLSADPATAERMLARAVALIPRLAKAEIIGHRVGLRPARPSIRCEATDLGGRRVVHCYGHGGAGVTVSWGCADEVLGLVSG